MLRYNSFVKEFSCRHCLVVILMFFAILRVLSSRPIEYFEAKRSTKIFVLSFIFVFSSTDDMSKQILFPSLLIYLRTCYLNLSLRLNTTTLISITYGFFNYLRSFSCNYNRRILFGSLYKRTCCSQIQCCLTSWLPNRDDILSPWLLSPPISDN